MPSIRPISDLRNNANDISDFCRQTREPVYITRNGTGDMVVMNIDAYERQMALIDLYGKLAVAEEEVFADLLAEHLLDGLAGLDGVGVVMVDAEIGDAEAVKQVIAALLLRQARSAVGRAAGIAGGIDVHGKNQPLRMNRSAASTPFS